MADPSTHVYSYDAGGDPEELDDVCAEDIAATLQRGEWAIDMPACVLEESIFHRYRL